jgi:tetratricopeptide (TPR) repeat protein
MMKHAWAVRRLSLLLVLALAAATLPARAQRPADLRIEAYRLYNAGRLQEAIPLLDGLLERKPRDLEAHIKRGNCYARLNQPERALPDYQWVIGYFPAWAPPYIDRGIAWMMLGRLDLAESDFRRALQLFSMGLMTRDPAMTAYLDTSWNVVSSSVPINLDTKGIQRALAHCGLAQVYHRLGRNAEAIAEYDWSLRLNPRDPNGYAGRADALAALGPVEPALADYEQALRLAPLHAHAIAGRADVLARLGEPQRALDELERALRLDPGDARARRVRAGLLSRLGRNGEALGELDAVLLANPRDAGAWKDRGGVLVRLGRPGEAIRALDEALRLDPRRATAYLNRGTAYNALGYPERAIVDLGEAIRLDPGNPTAHFSRAEVYARVHRFLEAIHGYEEALRLDPNLAPARAGLARARGALGLPGTPPAEPAAAALSEPRPR